MLKFINLIQKNGLKARYKKLVIKSLNLKFFNKYLNSGFFPTAISSIFHQFNPVFSYLITKVGKQQRKNSRNKSHKYFFLWKYTPLYKRFKIFLKIFSKEIKYTKEIKLTNKLKHVFNNLYLKYPLFIDKYITFSSSYVFKNLKFKLFTKYLTSK